MNKSSEEPNFSAYEDKTTPHRMVAIGDKEMDVTTTCPVCGVETVIRVEAYAYGSWKGGTLIQLAFPGLSDLEREALISGLCPEHNKEIVALGKEMFL